ncbi:MAG: TraB/GumN family protein [Treponema sp.]|nr:TraB/GumN family protein [Spirochaetia bacterium]MDY2825463.1 TraB/GumN family protein [Treponema sp.]
MSQTQKVLELNNRKITLIGTAHVSAESISEVENVISDIKPDCVAIELDEKRYESITNPDKYRELDIIKVLKRKEGFLLLANIVMASFQKRMGKNAGVKPGEEMVAAINKAKELNIPTALVDRPIQITFRRAWKKTSAYGKTQLLSALLASGFSKDEISSEEIENLKQSSEMDSMMKELSELMPAVKQVLIDERDQYLASHIWKAEGNNIVAVLGAGHLPGVEAHLKKIAENQASTDTSEIASIPESSIFSKIMMWLIPALIVAVIAFGFYIGGKDAGSKMALNWILWNGILAGLGALIAGGNPLTILVSFVGAPVTSLCPFIGVGIVAGIVQAAICKPQVKDLETLSDDAGSIKGFYKNKILRVLLVFLLSSVGSSIGTFAAGAGIVINLSEIISKILHRQP